MMIRKLIQKTMPMPQLLYLLCCIIVSRVSFASTATNSSSPTSFPRTSYTYYLGSGLPSTWYNNNSIAMEGGAKMRVLMVIQDYNRGIGLYCGFYSAGNLRYSFSVVAVGGNSHDVVWSAERGRSVVGDQASLQLSRDRGLVLRESNGTEVWSSGSADKKAVAGMNLTASGNLVLFGDGGSVLWQSFDNVSDTLLVGQRLPKGQNLVPDLNHQRGVSPFFARLVSARNFSAFFDAGDGRTVMYYGLGLDGNARTRFGLEYREEGIVENIGTFNASDLLESIGFVKLSADGHLKMYSYKASGSVRQVFDMFAMQCEAFVGGYLLDEVRNLTYAASNNVAPVASVKTPNDCKKACLKSCSCNAAFFRNEDGKCYLPSEIYLGNNANRGEEIAFIRALNPNGIPVRSVSWVARHRKPLAAGGASTVAVVLLVCVMMWLKNKKDEDIDKNLNMVTGMPLRFSYEALETATENFKESLGSGGFGSVFKGVLEDGTGIAVKRLEKLSQGVREFVAEVETIGSLHHFNLVRLVGFCAEKSERLLVYEHMTNGSLDNWIFNRGHEERRHLDWETRKKIILDVAKGLTYLHEECRKKIIHLDIKPHNILLDDNFNAKVSDFGLSTLIGRDESQVLTKMRGTPGYLAPEWKEMRVTVKVDVYSFGIVLLEVVSKRRNVESSRSETSFHLLKMLQKKAEENQIVEIVEQLDEDMERNVEEVTRMIRIGAWCLQDDPDKRPSMSTVVKAIEGVTEVDKDIRFKFSHALASSASASKNYNNYNHVTVAPQPSFLSAPR